MQTKFSINLYFSQYQIIKYDYVLLNIVKMSKLFFGGKLLKTSKRNAESSRNIIKKRIEELETININNCFSLSTIDEVNVCVIQVHLYRAVLQYASAFNKYVQNTNKWESRHIILDLSNTLFLDSTFLGSILGFYKRLKKEGKTLKLIVDYEKITILTLIDNYRKIFDIFPTIDEAVNSYTSDDD